MRKSRFTERQIVVVLKQAEAGVPIQDLIRKYGICEQTFYRWKKKFGGLEASELQQLKQLKRGESASQGPGGRSDARQADPARGSGKKSLKAVRRREIIDWAREEYPVSARAACSLLQFPRSSYYYQSRRDPRVALRMRLKELAASRPRFGYRRLHLLLRREGWKVNHKVIHRLYCEEGLQVRTRKRRKVAMQPRLKLDQASRVDERWSMDFVTDQLADGRYFRVFTVVDQFSRECVALHAALSIRSKDVGKVLDTAITPAKRSGSDHLRQWERSSLPATLMPGRTFERSTWISFGLASPWRMPSSNPSTVASVTNA